MTDCPSGFRSVSLRDDDAIYVGSLPEPLCRDDAGFQQLWDLHPESPHRVRRGGIEYDTPRWQQAFVRDYAYTGSTNHAAPLPSVLAPYLDWVLSAVDNRLNGLLVNWYDLSQRHYIGKHKDSPRGLSEGAPITTISFGATRLMRFARGKRQVDLDLGDGTVLVIPAAINGRWSHEIPQRAAIEARRISVTFRAFEDA